MAAGRVRVLVYKIHVVYVMSGCPCYSLLLTLSNLLLAFQLETHAACFISIALLRYLTIARPDRTPTPKLTRPYCYPVW
jgi:hypothetical protein